MGLPALEDLAYNAANLKLNIHVLTMLSVFGTIFLGRSLEGALLLLLFAAAGLLEDRLSMAARGDLNKLFTSAPSHALVVEDLNCLEDAQSLPVNELPVGTLMVVKAGEQVPLDGVVVSGGALVSMELITGESMPVGKGVGDELPAGSENHAGLDRPPDHGGPEAPPAAPSAPAPVHRPLQQDRALLQPRHRGRAALVRADRVRPHRLFVPGGRLPHRLGALRHGHGPRRLRRRDRGYRAPGGARARRPRP